MLPSTCNVGNNDPFDPLYQNSEEELPGPTGERNLLRLIQRDPILCAGPDRDTATEQATLVRALGGRAYVPEGDFQPEDAQWTDGFSAILWWGDAETARKFSIALAKRPGPIIPLIVDAPDVAHAFHERHLCIDTTAAGGNAELFTYQRN